jgi:chemotaxis protein MotB
VPDSDKKQELLIIKRTRGGSHFHHGGAWKIAFADFMTAMMALFLVLWLLSATNVKTKASLARYFNPVNLVDMSPMKRGIRDPSNATTGGNDSEAPQSEAAPALTQDQNPSPDGKPDEGSANSVERPPTHSETALFRDPYAVLAEIAASGEPEKAAKSSESSGEDGSGLATDAYKDPFTPAVPNPPPGTPNAPSAAPNAAAATPVPADKPNSGAMKSDSAAKPEQSAAMQQPAPSQPSANTKTDEPAPAELPKPAQQVPQGEAAASRLKSEIAQLVGQTGKGDAAPNIEVNATDEGVLIRLTDESNFAMFAIGSAEPQPKTVKVMEKIAQVLKAEKGAIIIGGHTDARPYKSATYDNWRLSSARAQMAYYMLVRGGLDEKRIEKIEGYADRKPKIPDNPLADENRRIEIFLRMDKP